MSAGEMREFHPELLPNRGEITAWALALLAGLGLAILHFTWTAVPGWAWIFWIFLFFAAASISFGNWMDRHTLIRTGEDGIEFLNGLRHVRFTWPEVQKVNVLPARWGRTVQVLGENAHFEFRTYGVVEYQGEVRGHIGFVAGQEILDTVLSQSGLSLAEKTEDTYYYARI
jgi:hypothetical protein